MFKSKNFDLLNNFTTASIYACPHSSSATTHAPTPRTTISISFTYRVCVGAHGLGPGLGGPWASVAFIDGGVCPWVEVAGGSGEALVGLEATAGDVYAGVGGTEEEEEQDQRSNGEANEEQVATQREMLTGTGEQVDDNQLYYDVVGGHDKKRRIYGLGSYGCSIVNGSTSDNTSGNMTPTSRPPDNATPASVQDEIQSLKATILLMQQRLDAIDGGRAGTSSSPPSQTD
nr:uncharacterized protein LOC109155276 isoform X2 [Ipomoea batatas]